MKGTLCRWPYWDVHILFERTDRLMMVINPYLVTFSMWANVKVNQDGASEMCLGLGFPSGRLAFQRGHHGAMTT